MAVGNHGHRGDGAGMHAPLLGSNQSGMRAHNERLLLSLLRRHGPLPKAAIARLTGLSAQTVSVIMRGLEDGEILLRGEPQRGRVGQPSIPMSLNPDGAYFFGLTIGRRWTELVLADFCGAIRDRVRVPHDYPDPDGVLAVATDGIAEITARQGPRVAGRIGGLGVAKPFQIWDWHEELGVPPDALAPWRERSVGDEIGRQLGFPVVTQNDATAACAAELVFGNTPSLPPSFLHLSFSYFIGGGLVLDEQLFTGVSGNAAAIGSMPVPLPGGATGQLIDAASLRVLAERVAAAGKPPEGVFALPVDWRFAADEVRDWTRDVVPALAWAITAAASIVDIDAVLIDGLLPDDVRRQLVAEISAALDQMDFAGIGRPEILGGTIGPDATSLGAASLPLAQRFLV